MRIATLILISIFSVVTHAEDLWGVIPGHSFGKITKLTSFKSLQEIYGKNNVIHNNISIGEGEYRKGITIFPNEETKRAEILLNKKGFPSRVQIYARKTLWHTSEGITINTSLKELEVINAKEFNMLGFGWDYSGTVVDWLAGNLSKYKGSLIVRLKPKSRNYSNILLGDKVISSKQKEMKILNPTVYQFSVNL